MYNKDMQFFDTHCHIHSSDYKLEREEVYKRAIEAGVTQMICVGTDVKDSELAVKFAAAHKNVYASVGVHPHEAKHGVGHLRNLIKQEKVIAIGETGLDYFYNHSDRKAQIAVFEQQIQLAVEFDLPIIFHVREAYDDFWPIINNFSNVRGVLHSFTDTWANVEKALQKELYIGVNGISTFTKDADQKEMFANLPRQRVILETDAPYLTPVGQRGKVNEPAFVVEVAKHLSTIWSIPVETIANQTTSNATQLFNTSREQ